MSDPKTPSPARKAIAYAEDTLEVNSAYENAKALAAEIDLSQVNVAHLRSVRRTTEELLAERELDVTIEETSKHASMSVAALERHLKVVIPKDTLVRDLRHEVNEALRQLEEAEASLRSREWDLKIAVARLQELGGYLNYLAAVKQSANIKSEKPETQQ